MNRASVWRRNEYRKCARSRKGYACKDAIVFFIFYVQNMIGCKNSDWSDFCICQNSLVILLVELNKTEHAIVTYQLGGI